MRIEGTINLTARELILGYMVPFGTLLRKSGYWLVFFVLIFGGVGTSRGTPLLELFTDIRAIALMAFAILVPSISAFVNGAIVALVLSKPQRDVRYVVEEHCVSGTDAAGNGQTVPFDQLKRIQVTSFGYVFFRKPFGRLVFPTAAFSKENQQHLDTFFHKRSAGRP